MRLVCLIWQVVAVLAFKAPRIFTRQRTSSLRLVALEEGGDAAADLVALSKIKDTTGSELSAMLESMPTSDKYNLLLQSYASSIMESSVRNATVLQNMESLYTEMLSMAIRPSDKAAQSLIDAASTFCSSAKLGRALQLSKAGGVIRAFGAANSQITKPVTSAAATGFWSGIEVPTDDRETEVLYAGIVAGAGLLYALLQGVGVFQEDVKPWAALWGVATVLVGSLDVGLRAGKGLKFAAVGVDRLVMRDAEREAHSEGAAFLVGYLVGLPCFPFQPDLGEALSMLRTNPGALSVYKQPVAMLSGSAYGGGDGGGKKKGSGGGFLNDIMNSLASSSKGSGGSKVGGSSSSTALANVATSSSSSSSSSSNNKKIIKALLDVDANAKADVFDLGRVLIWLMAPVAAESLKYGKTVVSDPRRCRRILEVLDKVQAAERKAAAASTASSSSSSSSKSSSIEGGSGNFVDLPSSEADKEALLKWAYFEAQSLVRQYGDLLEDVRDYIYSGTSSVGECCLLVEQELR